MMNKHLEETWDGKSSFFTRDIDSVQKLVSDNAGLGYIIEKQVGQQYKEIVEVEQEIGYNIDVKTSEAESANGFVIHYTIQEIELMPSRQRDIAGEEEKTKMIDLEEYEDKNVFITKTNGISLKGYVIHFFPGQYNDDGIDSIGLMKKKGDRSGIEISLNEIKKIEVID